MTWDPRRYGSREDPVRQSDVQAITGAYGCPARFRFRKDDASGTEVERTRAYPERVLGSATHEVLKRILRRFPEQACQPGFAMPERALGRAFDEELERAREGLPIEWGKKRELDEVRDRIAMIRGALRTLPRFATELVLVEAEFLVEIDCGAKAPYWMTGTIDLAFRGHDGELVLADWKTGATKPNRIVLDHGVQFGFYRYALAHVPSYREGDLRKDPSGPVGDPCAVYIAHLRDFVPYKKKTRRQVDGAEAEVLGIEPGLTTFEAGSPRGPGWYRGLRSPQDEERLKRTVRGIVASVRMRHFLDVPDERCGKCFAQDRCLTAGVEDPNEKRRLGRLVEQLDFDGLEDVA